MKLGIYGGSFDPVHLGHLILAESCREACGLDEIWLIPCHQQPLKQAGGQASGPARAEMLELATAGVPEFHVQRMELDREGTSYTFETLTQIKQQRPDDDLFFLIGADSLKDFSTWREPELIAELATIVAVNRGGESLPDEVELREQLGEKIWSRVKLVSMPDIAISSSEIRQRLEKGNSIRYLTPRAVEIYLSEHQLYVD